jgi:hypothetical protein
MLSLLVTQEESQDRDLELSVEERDEQSSEMIDYAIQSNLVLCHLMQFSFTRGKMGGGWGGVSVHMMGFAYC